MKNTKVVLIVLIFSLLMYSSCAVPVLKREDKPWNNCYDWEKTKFVTIEGPLFFSSSSTTTRHFAITSGTSGCDKVSNYQEFHQQVFIAHNFKYLLEESAKGSGDHIKALATLVGCSEKSHTKFEEMVHADYETLFHDDPETSPIVLLEKLTNKISKNSVLMVSCQN